MMDQAATATNASEMTVSELSGALKRTIEDRFGYVKVRGEITGYRGPHSSGHVYFGLKDQNARIDAVIWKGVFGRLRTKPQEGLEVIATGKITTFPGKSSYQIVVEAIEPAGVGALMALLEERRRKLSAEGLFDEARKRPLPYLPGVIGVVTSPTGAVIRDILHRLAERFARHVVVWPVRVQGETSAQEVATAIAGFNALPLGGTIARPDVLIVARGGGSLEDLWGFNDEAVVRAAAASTIALIAAIGHETDWTLIDHVADLRAPTPTAAAEKAVPVRLDLLAATGDLARRLQGAVRRALEQQRSQLRSAARALPDAEDVLAAPRQQLDRAGERLGFALGTGQDRRRLKLGMLAQKLARHSPQAEMARARARLQGTSLRLARASQVARERKGQQLEVAAQRLRTALGGRVRLARQQNDAARQRLDALGQRLRRAVAATAERRRARMAGLTQVLASLSYRNTLARGFALVRDGDGVPVLGMAQARAAARLDIEFGDGRINAVAEERMPAVAEARKGGSGKDRPAAAKPMQGDLF